VAISSLNPPNVVFINKCERQRVARCSGTSSLKCPECGSSQLRRSPDRGETVCTVCGLVVSSSELEVALQTPEGSHRSQPDRRVVDEPLYARLSKLDKWSVDPEIKAVGRIRTKISRIASRLEAPDAITDVSLAYYRRAKEMKLVRSEDGMTLAAIYLGLRTGGTPRSLKEVAAAGAMDPIKLGKCVRDYISSGAYRYVPDDPRMLVTRLGQALGITMPVQVIACELLKLARQRGITGGKKPASVAAAALFTACLHQKEFCTQTKVCRIAGITPVTLRAIFNELLPLLDSLSFESTHE
jgi:transcription initiation factor TFIIB